MNVTVKLFASLQKYLPSHAVKQEAPMTVERDTSVEQMLVSLGVPLEHCHLVVVNGVFVPPESRPSRLLIEGDTLAVWPPVAGG